VIRLLGLSLCLLSVLPAARAQQVLARYVDLPPGAQAQLLATGPTGNLYVAATFVDLAAQNRTRVLETDQDGRTLASMDLDLIAVSAGTVTPDGHLVLAGTPSSPDFPLISPIMPAAGPHSDVVVELNAGLTAIVFSSRIGGATGAGFGGGTSVTGVATDSAGNLYVTGATADIDFPITPGAFQSTPPSGDDFGSTTFAFLTAISADRKRLIFSTYFGDNAVNCLGGSHCVGVHARTDPVAVAVALNGDLVIAGTTTATKLPVTAAAYATQCLCNSDSPGGFAARFASGGNLHWATYLPLGNEGNFGELLFRRVSDIALDGGANVVLSGAATAGFLVSPGAIQPEVPGGGSTSGFVAKLDASGQRLLFGTFVGGTVGVVFTPEVRAVTVDPAGAIWITGLSDPALLPQVTGPALGNTYVGSISPDGTTANLFYTAPEGGAGQAIGMSGDSTVAVLGPAGSILLTTPASGPSLIGVANSAASSVSNAVVPLELISLYGIGLGPAAPLGAEIVGGAVTADLGGVQVIFDGTPAPLLYAGPNQVNAVVPQEVSGRETTSVQINTPQGVLQGLVMPVRQTQPAVFLAGSGGFAAALNQDGSVNSASNPAPGGSLVSVWGTGAGVARNSKPDGTIITNNAGPVNYPVSVIGSNTANPGTSLEVQYAGDAPGLVVGVVQINIQLPKFLGSIVSQGLPPDAPLQAALQLQIGDALSPPFSIYLRCPCGAGP
jgi:uncharacterized protein (TIGR03437 family)